MNLDSHANDRVYKLSKDELAREIVRVLTTNAHDKTDGEIVDEIFVILNKEGYIDYEPF